jgi:hypothetical protein
MLVPDREEIDDRALASIDETISDVHRHLASLQCGFVELSVAAPIECVLLAMKAFPSPVPCSNSTHQIPIRAFAFALISAHL